MSSRSSELTIAVQEIARAEGQARQALGLVLPSIDATGTVTHFFIRGTTTTPLGRITAPPTPVAVAALTATQPVLAPRAWYGVKTSRLAIDAAKLGVEDTQRLILASVADNVVSVVTAERVSEINRVGLRSSLERLELTRRRERLGTGTRLDVVRSEQDVALARAQLVNGDEALRRTREALALALGETEPYGVEAGISLNEIEQAVRSTCAPAGAGQRADVLAARTQVEISERTVTDAKLALAPYAEVSTTLAGYSEVQANGKHVQWSIQGLITIPIWDGGGRYGAIASARAGVEQQKARLGAAERAAGLESNQAVRSVLVAEQSRVVTEQARDLARETSRLTQVAFEAGTATSFDLVESGRRQREAELDLAVREFDVIKAKIAALLASASCKY
jgi:outer membrane protein TolC